MLQKEDCQKFLGEKFPKARVKFLGGLWSSFVFRFPKENIKDYETESKLLDFIRDKISFKIPKTTVVRDSALPYSRHKYLEGELWDIRQLEEENLSGLARDAAKFLAELHSISPADITRATGRRKRKGLRKLVDKNTMQRLLKNYMSKAEFETVFQKYKTARMKRPGRLVFVHGDFTGSNSLINKNRRLAAVID